MDGEPFPLAWCLVLSTWLPKPGKGATDRNNFRAIGLMSHLRKPFIATMLDPLRQQLSAKAPAIFVSFLPYRSAAHKILVVDQILRRFVKRNRRSNSLTRILGRLLSPEGLWPTRTEAGLAGPAKAFGSTSCDTHCPPSARNSNLRNYRP